MLTKESKIIFYWRTRLFTASRNSAYATDMLAYIFTLCTRFVAPLLNST